MKRADDKFHHLSWKGKWAETLSIARKHNETTLDNVSVSLLSVFLFLLMDRIPVDSIAVPDVKLRKVTCFKPGGKDFSTNQHRRARLA